MTPLAAGVAAAAATVAAAKSGDSAPTPGQPAAPGGDEAAQDMQDLIRSLSDGAQKPEEPPAPAPPLAEEPDAPEPAEEDEVFHPWDGEVAPEIVTEPEDTPAPPADVAPESGAAPVSPRPPEAESPEDAQGPAGSAETPDEDDDFDWDEAPYEEEALNFDPEPDSDDPQVIEHMAALERQKKADLRPELPDVSNVIQADIPQAPNPTMPSGRNRPLRGAPQKPTPVESVEDVEAAIRAQMLNVKKAEPKPETESAKSGLFGKKPKPASMVPEKAEPKAEEQPPAAPSNPLKEALLDFDDTPAPRRTRSGFMLVMILFLTALALYLFGDALAGMVPALAPLLEGYTGMIDSLRAMTQGLWGG